jgi:hypothetical protein
MDHEVFYSRITGTAWTDQEMVDVTRRMFDLLLPLRDPALALSICACVYANLVVDAELSDENAVRAIEAALESAREAQEQVREEVH